MVGTNGVKITENLAADPPARGRARPLALARRARRDAATTRFRRVRGAWRNTVEGAKILARAGLAVHRPDDGRRATTSRELAAIADFAHDELGAKVWNLYFLVPTGRGAHVSDLDATPTTTACSRELSRDPAALRRAACWSTPSARRTTRASWSPRSPSRRSSKGYAGGAGGCPAGTHYLGIRPNGDVTPCPYLPLFGGNLRAQSLTEIWQILRALRRDPRAAAVSAAAAATASSTPPCGGCRARAFGMTGDVHGGGPALHAPAGDVPEPAAPAVEYGAPAGRRRSRGTRRRASA